MSNRNGIHYATRLALTAVLAAATACTVHAPLKSLPEASSAGLAFEQTVQGIPQGEWPRSDWWTSLGDEQLSGLIQEGLHANPDVDAALARIQAAQAMAAIAGAPATPSIDATLNAQKSLLSENGIFPPPLGGSSLWQNKASLDFRWELDFWGAQRSALRGALREEQASRLDSALSALALSTAIARRYVEWQRLEDQLDIARALLEERESLLALTRRRVDAGIDSKLQLRSAEAGVPQARVDVTALSTQTAVARIELAALAGAGPDRGLALRRPAIATPALQGAPTLVPADLLARRTDVAAYRLRAEAAAARADGAEAQRYPNINLAASVGLDSRTFTDWLDTGSKFYNVGPAINLPLFGGGARRATVKLRAAEYDQAVAAYRQALLGAVQEVASTLAQMTSIDRERSDAEAAATGQTQSYDLTRRRYESGISSQIDVLVTQEQVLNLRRRVADLTARRLDASIRLVQSLGGGLPAPL